MNEIQNVSTTNQQIRRQIYLMLENKYEADPEVLSVIGSWGDTMQDYEILSMLLDINSGNPTLRPHCPPHGED